MKQAELNKLSSLNLMSGAEIFWEISENTDSFRFGNALKSFIYERTGLKRDCASPNSINEKIYSNIICEEFMSRQVPAHFDLAGGSLKTLSLNWLKEQSISRENVILLGFGLGMTLREVEYFLTDTLMEHKLSPKDPFETIAWYCFNNGLSFHYFEDLMAKCSAISDGTNADLDLANTVTAKLRRIRDSIGNEEELLVYTKRISIVRNGLIQSITARKHFMNMYGKVTELIEPGSSANAEKTIGNASRIERTLYLTTPLSKGKNLASFKSTELGKKLRCGRLTRQRIGQIIKGEIQVRRDYLITLSFLLDALDYEHHSANHFTKTTDDMLIDCGMCALSPYLPYDKLLTLCACTDDPLLSFAEAFEPCFFDSSEDTDA